MTPGEEEGVLQKRRKRSECGGDETDRPVTPARVRDVVAHETPRGTRRELPQSRATTLRVQIVGTPACVRDDFRDMVRDVTIRAMRNRAAQRANVVDRLEM